MFNNETTECAIDRFPVSFIKKVSLLNEDFGLYDGHDSYRDNDIGVF